MHAVAQVSRGARPRSAIVAKASSGAAIAPDITDRHSPGLGACVGCAVRMTRDASYAPADAASRPCVSVAAVAAVVAPVGTAVVATVDSVGDDHGPADGGGGPAPASCCQWHVRLLPSSLRATRLR